MTVALNNAAIVPAPHDVGRTANDFFVRKYTAETTHAANPVPDTWRGKWVELYVSGGTAGTDYVDYGFSKSSSAEVDRAVAASVGGATGKVGMRIPTGETRMVVIPVGGDPQNSTVVEDVYFVRESSAAGMVVHMRLAQP